MMAFQVLARTGQLHDGDGFVFSGSNGRIWSGSALSGFQSLLFRKPLCKWNTKMRKIWEDAKMKPLASTRSRSESPSWFTYLRFHGGSPHVSVHMS